MAESLPDELATLVRERDRLEQLLMLDANWRALRQLDSREACGEPLEAVDGDALRGTLEESLAGNRIYIARCKIAEAIELLGGTRNLVPPETGAQPMHAEPVSRPVRISRAEIGSSRQPGIASRIVLLGDRETTSFRTRLRQKPAAPNATRPTTLEPPTDIPAEEAAARIAAPLSTSAPAEPAPEPIPSTAPTDRPSLATIATTIGSLAAAARNPPTEPVVASCAKASPASPAAFTPEPSGPPRILIIAAEDAPLLCESAEAGCEAERTRWERAFDRRERGQMPSGRTDRLPASPSGPQLPNDSDAYVAAAETEVTVEVPIRVPVEHEEAGVTTAGDTADLEAEIEIRIARPEPMPTPVTQQPPSANSNVMPPEPPSATSPEEDAVRDDSDWKSRGPSLMRRLDRARRPAKFNRHDYAAYYEPVEEASVSIVRPAAFPAPEAAPATPAPGQPDSAP